MFWPIRISSIIIALALCFAIDFVAGQYLSDFFQTVVVRAGLFVTLAVSLNLINGITGQFSLGHAAFYQVGAYFAGYTTFLMFQKQSLTEMPWLFLMLVGGAAMAAVAGLIVGLPSLRLRGDYLAIVTLGFGEIIRVIVQGTEAIGGPYGMNVTPKIEATWLVWLLAIICIAVCRNLLKTAQGLPFLSVREDEVASSAMGVNVTRVKVTAFLIGSAFAGAAGALFAHYEGFISPTTFAMDQSFIILTMVVLGGNGSITGSVVAALFLSYLPEGLRQLTDAQGNPLMVTSGSVVAGLIAVLLIVAAIRHVMHQQRGTSQNRALIYVGFLIGGIVFAYLMGMGLNQIPALESKVFPAERLRMVIFAVTLVAVMLLRPQGVFAHHEFSWTWVKKVLGIKKGPETAVSA